MYADNYTSLRKCNMNICNKLINSGLDYIKINSGNSKIFKETPTNIMELSVPIKSQCRNFECLYTFSMVKQILIFFQILAVLQTKINNGSH